MYSVHVYEISISGYIYWKVSLCDKFFLIEITTVVYEDLLWFAAAYIEKDPIFGQQRISCVWWRNPSYAQIELIDGDGMDEEWSGGDRIVNPFWCVFEFLVELVLINWTIQSLLGFLGAPTNNLFAIWLLVGSHSNGSSRLNHTSSSLSPPFLRNQGVPSSSTRLAHRCGKVLSTTIFVRPP